MNKILMPNKDKLFETIETILRRQNDVEIRVKGNGEVAIYELERKKKNIDL